MKPLDSDRIAYLVIHTAAKPGDTTAAEIDRWHKARGWDQIGYHWVIRKSGQLETGRDLRFQGAHVLGLNDRSIGVCCAGDGDTEAFTPEQEATLIDLAVRFHRIYGIQPKGLIGHREVNRLIAEGIVPAKYQTDKSCPGRLVHMPRLRRMFVDALFPPPEPLSIELPTAA